MPFLSRTAAAAPETPALFTREGVVSYGALESEAEGVARRLVALGVVPGSVVALKGLQTPEVVAALHGIWRARGVSLTMNPRWTPWEETRTLELLDPLVVLVGAGVAPPLLSEGAGRVLTLDAHEEGGGLLSLGSVPPDPEPLPSPAVSQEEWNDHPGAHILTSGSSGAPKVVTLTLGNLRASAEGARERLGLQAAHRWLASLSLAHVGGLALVSRAALVGSGLVLEGGFDAGGLASLLDEGAVTHASLVPTMLQQLLEVWGDRTAPPTLRCLLIGGAPAGEPLLKRALERGFPLAVSYGLTEASSQVATAEPRLTERKPGTVGRPLPGVEVVLAQDGEILVRGATVAPGHLGEDGWLHTGDLGRLDEEGELWVTGRLSHRIISGGVNVEPAEVEAVILAHPAIREAVVVGIPHPRWGEVVVAAVVEEPGAGVDPGELDGMVRSILSRAKCPRVFLPVEGLPRNPNGKVDRDRVRSLFKDFSDEVG